MNPLPLKYLFRVEFEDGTQFQQIPADVDSQNPHKSSFTEYLRLCETKKPLFFFLESEIDTYFVDLHCGAIFHDNEMLVMPETRLLHEKNELRVVYYRTVQQHHIFPAIFHSPRKLRQIESGELQVTDKDGNDHVFPENSTVYEEMHGADHQYFVYSKEDSQEIVSYRLGWQTTVFEENGHLQNLERTIEIK